MHRGVAVTEGVRIFISLAGKDRAWAERAAWYLRAAGYATELDSVDWAAGTNFVEAMHRAVARSNPMVVLLSAAYLEADRFTTDEWTARLAQRRRDPDAKLIPIRVDDVDLQNGLWAPVVAADVFGVTPARAVGESPGRIDAGPVPAGLGRGPPRHPVGGQHSRQDPARARPT